MSQVVRITEHFAEEYVGRALGRLWDVNGLTCSLTRFVDADGDGPMCPITLAQIGDAAMLQDGSIYDMGNIMKWLRNHSESPLTNLRLQHNHVLHLSSLRRVVDSFLSVCRDRRAEVRAHRERAVREQCITASKTSINALHNKIGEIHSYMAVCSSEIEA